MVMSLFHCQNVRHALLSQTSGDICVNLADEDEI